MIVDLTVRPDNPLYDGMKIKSVEKRRKLSHFLDMKMDQDSVQQFSRNFDKLMQDTEDDGLPVQLTGDAPHWVYLVAVRDWVGLSESKLEYKKGKEKITLSFDR
jgi:PHD/YefM family antitoxin component YafN of YafNO toxin-antitoxin module